MSTAIWWMRRDLRLSDNQALEAAFREAEVVIPVFILDPALLNSPYIAEKRVAFLFDGLRSLDADLRLRGSRLIIRHGSPRDELTRLFTETGASGIFAERDYSPFAHQRDTSIAMHLPLHLTGGVSVHPPDFVHKKDGTPYSVYTPFKKAWKSLHTPQHIQVNRGFPDFSSSAPRLPASLPIPDTPVHPPEVPFKAGEREAHLRLKQFLDGPIQRYAQERDKPGANGTSSLSPYLRFGMISSQQVTASASQAITLAPNPKVRKSAETWLDELIWREFFISILYHFPKVRKHSFRDDMHGIDWVNNQDDFEAWQSGMTGYPIVDAGMRQLTSSGWMHNRVRMITASFLVKHLLIDWRWGERWFMQNLIDGDPAANNGGWQWTAGTGTDAAPYFRVFNPTLQGVKFDPDGEYVRRWIPELRGVPVKLIHKPWEMSTDEQRRFGCKIGYDYPAPLVEHSGARQRALAAYKAAREKH